MKLSQMEKQLILYTKGHFKKSGNLIEDLKVFVGEAYALSLEHVEMYSIYNFVIQTYDKLMYAKYITHQSPTEYLLTKIYSRDLKRDDNSLLEFLLGDISIVKVKGLDLGLVDLENQMK